MRGEARRKRKIVGDSQSGMGRQAGVVFNNIVQVRIRQRETEASKTKRENRPRSEPMKKSS